MEVYPYNYGLERRFNQYTLWDNVEKEREKKSIKSFKFFKKLHCITKSLITVHLPM